MIWLHLILGLSSSPTSAVLCDRAMDAYHRQDDSGALMLLHLARKEDPADVGVRWRESFVRLALANREKDGIRRGGLLDLGAAQAESLVVENPSNADAWFVGSLAVGIRSQTAGPRNRVALSKVLRIRLNQCLGLDPNHAGAWYLLGRWHEGIATLSMPERIFANLLLGGIPPGASMDSAVICLQRADRLHPGDLQVILDLARIQFELGRRSEAIATCRRGLSTPPLSAGDLVNLRALGQLHRRLEG